MAYISSEKVKAKRDAIKAAFPAKDGWKFSIRNHHYSSISVDIEQAPWNLLADKVCEQHHQDRYADVNQYWVDKHWQGRTLEALKTIIAICQEGNHDNSDIMTDYHDVGWYLNVSIGRWDKPFVVKGSK